MGSVRWNLLMIGVLTLVTALPAVAAEADMTAHGIEVAAVATLTAVEEVTAPWQPLFVGVDEVVEGNNPVVGFGVLGARTNDSVSRLSQTLPDDSPLEIIQPGSIPYYEGQGAVTFALLQSPLPAERVEGEAVEFAFYWRWADQPTQPANPEANGDATVDATNTFSIGTVAGEAFTTFTQSDGTTLVEYDSRSIAAWEFVADDLYNVLIAIPGLPEAVWGSALNAQSTSDANGFAIQIVPEFTGFSEEFAFTLTEQGVLRAPDLTTPWIQITSDGRTVADLTADSEDSEVVTEQVDAGAALPANPPVEVDVTGQVVDPSASDASGSLWRWIVGVFAGAGLIAFLLWLVIYRPKRRSSSWSEIGTTVNPEQAKTAARRWQTAGARVIDGHVIGSFDQWMEAIDGFDMHVTAEDRLRGYVSAVFGKGHEVVATGDFRVFQFEVRSAAVHPLKEYSREWERAQIDYGTLVGVELETGVIRSIPLDARIEQPVPWPTEDAGDAQPWTDEERKREGEPMLGGHDKDVDKHGRPL